MGSDTQHQVAVPTNSCHLASRSAAASATYDQTMKVQAAVVQAAPIGFDRQQTMDKLERGRRHLHRLLDAYTGHYDRARLHRGLDLDPPDAA